MKYVVALVMTVFAWSAHAQYIAKQAFPNLPNFALPLGIENAKDGTNRLFVVEQKGKIFVFQNSPSVSTRKLFIDLADVVSQGGGEMGLLGLAFHPNYKNNGYFYVNYTTTKGYPRLTSVTSRFSVSTSNVDSAVRSSELVLHTVQQPHENHNGGCIKFGPDGYLYISYGDGGSGGDPLNRAQNLDSLFGKILRIDVDNPSGGKNFGIPSSNPYASSENANRKQVFAYGLRNVWRMSFDPITGKLWAGDVGQGTWEEIDIIESGKNYGWKVLEGKHCYSPSSGCDSSNKVMPVIEYRHANGDLSVTGGYVYRGSLNPGLYGKYIYGDYGTGRIWMADEANPTPTNQLLIETVNPKRLLSTFGVDENDELYFTAFYPGRIWTIESTQPTLATPTLGTPKNDSINTPTTLTFSWNSIATATSYDIQVSTSSAFTSTVKDSTLAGTSATFILSYSTQYYWRVRAKNSTLTSSWSASRTFTTFTPLTAPILIAPKNDSVEAPITMTLSWNAVNTAKSYEVLTAFDPGFTQFVRDTTVIGTSVRMLFASGTMHFWKVRAKNAMQTSEWSEMRTFTVRMLSIAPETAPIQIYPEKDQVVSIGIPVNNIPWFNWDEVKDATQYMVQVSDDSTFTSLIDSLITTKIRVDFTAKLRSTEGQYLWRVRACNDVGCGPWSPIWGYSLIHLSVESESQKQRSISIYPNPSTGSFTVSSESEHIKDIRIYDVKGAAVAFERSGEEECSLTRPVAGTYFVEVSLQDGGKVVKKIVVE
jgi:glucose/arabinose dehydrogenase